MRFPFRLLRPTLRRVVSLDFVLIVSMRRGIAMAFNLQPPSLAAGVSDNGPSGLHPSAICKARARRRPDSRLPFGGTHFGGERIFRL